MEYFISTLSFSGVLLGCFVPWYHILAGTCGPVNALLSQPGRERKLDITYRLGNHIDGHIPNNTKASHYDRLLVGTLSKVNKHGSKPLMCRL